MNKIGHSLTACLAWDCPKFQIFGTIVRSYSIFMMNYFKSLQMPTNYFFHHMTMFKDCSVLHSYGHISLPIKSMLPLRVMFPSSELTQTRDAAEKFLGFINSNARFKTIVWFPAVWAFVEFPLALSAVPPTGWAETLTSFVPPCSCSIGRLVAASAKIGEDIQVIISVFFAGLRYSKYRFFKIVHYFILTLNNNGVNNAC